MNCICSFKLLKIFVPAEGQKGETYTLMYDTFDS